MKITNSQKRTNKFPSRTVAFVSAAILLLIGGYLVYGLITKNTWPFTSSSSLSNDNESPRSVNDVNYDPPTKEDTDGSQAAKKENSTQAESTDQNNIDSSKTIVAVGVSYSDVINKKLEIRSFVPGIIEGGGTCTATITKGSQSITASSEAFIDSSSSVCTPIYIPLSEIPENGDWSLVVTYNSNSATGSSGNIGVKI